MGCAGAGDREPNTSSNILLCPDIIFHPDILLRPDILYHLDIIGEEQQMISLKTTLPHLNHVSKENLEKLCMMFFHHLS